MILLLELSMNAALHVFHTDTPNILRSESIGQPEGLCVSQPRPAAELLPALSPTQSWLPSMSLSV